MSSRESRAVVRSSACRRRQSKERPPSMSDLRIVLLGKSVSENSRVGNFLLGRAAFDSEAPPDVVERVGGRLKDRYVMVINSPQLLQTNISDHQITQTVRECVNLSDPGPHAFILVLQHNDFTEEDMRRVKYVLEKFSKEAIKRTIVITTDEETQDAKGAPMKSNELIHQFTAECGGGHLQLDNEIKRQFFGVSQQLEKILRENNEEFLTCELYSDVSKVQQIPINIQNTAVSSLSSRRIVLLGQTGVGRSSAGNTILGERVFRSVMSSSSVTHATVSGRSVSVVDAPGIFNTQIKSEELMIEIEKSVYLSSPGPHAFLIVFILNDRFNGEEQQILQMIEMMFGKGVLKYSIILFTHGDVLEEETVEELIQRNSRLRRLVDQCGGRYHVFNNTDQNNREQVNDLLQKIDTMIEQNGGGHYSNQMFEDALRFR